VLGNGNARGRNHDGGRGRDVPGADAVAAGADDVDGVSGRGDLQRALAHDGCACRDFLDGFAAHAQAHQESRDLGGGRLAGHDGFEGRAGRGGVERPALGEPRDDGFEVGHAPSELLTPFP
jgi:hypothetical protein